MKLEVLGSGGAVTTPKPLCSCSSCLEAKKNGFSYSRFGPSVFIHGPDLLIDTPEEIYVEINRSTITNLNGVLYSHWHPDHTAGKRIFEINIDWTGLPAKNKSTKLILPNTIADTFSKYMFLMQSIKYHKSIGIIDLITIGDNEEYNLGKYSIKPIQMHYDYVFGYWIKGEGKNVLVCMDEIKSWIPDTELLNTKFDLIYLPFGIFDVNPLTNERLINENHPILKDEQVINETIGLVEKLDSKKFILSHIEETDNITIELGKKLSMYYSDKVKKDIEIASDMMIYEI